jgi:hypothetical protein
MSNDIDFQIICTGCGCLSVRIEQPLTATREAIVYCGDCGTSRGTVGALRDLAVQRHSDFVLSTTSAAPPVEGLTTTNSQPARGISTRYAELRRLRRQVEIAEWLAHESYKSSSGRNRGRNARQPVFHPSCRTEVTRIDDERNRKSPR